MSEYWKSTPKYYCKHCKTFVVDTPVSKKNHDASPKHQGALKRFLRDLHRATEREATAATSAKREVARLNALVSGAPPSSSSSSSSTGLPPPTFKPAPARAATEDERKRHLKELESLGVALPDEARRELAMLGDWTVTAEAPGGVREKEVGGGGEKERLRAELKRKHDADEQERRWEAMDEDERAMRGFRIQTRTYPPGGAGAVGGFRPMVFKGKGKAGAEVKKEEGEGEEGVVKKEEEEAAVKKEEEEEEAPRIKKEETDMEGVVDVKAEVNANEAVVKKEKEEPENVSDGIVFKKRKVKNIRKRT